MKKLIILILLLASFKLSAQEIGNYKIKTRLDSTRYELDYTRYCMFRFHKQMTNGLSMQYVGLVLGGSTIYISSTNENMKDLGLYGPIIGGLLTVIGIITEISSYKWFRYASLGPDKYGIGLSIYLDHN